MSTIFIRLCVIMCTFFVQFFLSSLFSSTVKPSVIFLLVIIWTLFLGFQTVWPYIISIGFLYDVLFFDPVGLQSIIFLILSYVTGFITHRLSPQNRIYNFLLIFLLITFSFILQGLLRFLLSDFIFRHELYISYIFAIFFTTCLFFPFCRLYQKIESTFFFYQKKILLK